MKYLYTAAFLTICAIALSVPACGSGDAGVDGGAGGGGGGDSGEDGGVPKPMGGEEDLGTAVQAIAVKTQALMNAFVTEGGQVVLDETAGASVNAAAVKDALAAGVSTGCATIQYTDGSAKVTADFSAACPIATAGVAVTGHVEATVAVDAGAVTVTFAFINLAIDGYPNITASGSVTTQGTGALAFAVDVSSPLTFAFSGSVTISGDTLVVSGTGSYTKDGSTWALTLAGVTWKSGDCYPSSGSVSMKTGPVTETLTFTADTAATGKATLSVGRATQEIQLKAYGSCP